MFHHTRNCWFKGGKRLSLKSITMYCITVLLPCMHSLYDVGVLLGDPYGESKFIAHPMIKQRDIKATEAVCNNGKKFVLARLDVFFNKATLARSLVTRKEGRDLLDPDVIQGIRCKVVKSSVNPLYRPHSLTCSAH